MTANDHAFADGSRKQLVNAHTRNRVESRRLILLLDKLDEEMCLRKSQISCEQRMISKEMREWNPKKYLYKGVMCPRGLSYEDRELYKCLTREKALGTMISLEDFDKEFKKWRLDKRQTTILDGLTTSLEKVQGDSPVKTEQQVTQTLEFIRKAEHEIIKLKNRLNSLRGQEHLPALSSLPSQSVSLARQRTMLANAYERMVNENVTQSLRRGRPRDAAGDTTSHPRLGSVENATDHMGRESFNYISGKIELSREKSAFISTPGVSSQFRRKKTNHKRRRQDKGKMKYRSISMPEMVNKVADIRKEWDSFPALTVKTLQGTTKLPVIKTDQARHSGNKSRSLPASFWRQVSTFHYSDDPDD